METSTDIINDAKNWYLQSTKTTSKRRIETGIKFNNYNIGLEKDILWDKAETYTLSDGTEIVGVPMNVRLSNSAKITGNLFLLITKNGTKYKRAIVNDKGKTVSTQSIATQDSIEGLYKLSFNSTLTDRKLIKATKNGVMNAPLPPPGECFDIVYYEYTFDENGILLDYYEEIIGEYCPTGNGSGGGGGEGGTDEVPEHTTTGDDVSSSAVIDFESDGVSKKKWNEVWRFGIGHYMGYEFGGMSVDLCVMKWSTSENKFVWESVSNSSYYTSGVRPDGTEFVKDGYADNYFDTYAEVQFTSHINYINRGQRSTTPKSKFHKFYNRY